MMLPQNFEAALVGTIVEDYDDQWRVIRKVEQWTLQTEGTVKHEQYIQISKISDPLTIRFVMYPILKEKENVNV